MAVKAHISQKGKKFSVTLPKDVEGVHTVGEGDKAKTLSFKAGTVEFDDPMQAFAYGTAYENAAEALASKALSVSVTYRGQVSIQGNDVEKFGKFPIAGLTGASMEALIAQWPEIVAFYEANKSKIAKTWRSLAPVQTKEDRKAAKA